MGRQLMAGWALVFGCVGWVGGATYYVDGRATGANDGSSWADAFVDLQVALDAAIKGDEIRVGEGTYKPTVPGGDRAISFVLPDGVSLYGNYPGFGAEDPEDRSFDTPTILSGDLNGNDARDLAETLMEDPSRQDNSYHVVQTQYVYPSTPSVIDGFVITGGNANGDHYTKTSGGGIDASTYNLIVQNCIVEFNTAAGNGGGCNGVRILSGCIIRTNYARYGGGVEGPRTLNSCWIEDNAAEVGGGISTPAGEEPYVDCVFRGNRAVLGGAVYITNQVSWFERCLFSDNRASGEGGAIYIMSECTCPSELMIYRCHMIDNRSGSRGGAIFHKGNPRVVLFSCLIERNHAADNGGGIYSLTYEGMREMGYLGVTNCTIVANEAAQTGGLWFCSATMEYLDVVNTILWGNADVSGSGRQEGQIRISVGCGENGTGGDSVPPMIDLPVPVHHSCIEGLTAGYGGEGNIGIDPQFVAFGTDTAIPNDFHLTADSPCVNAGSNAAYPCVSSQPDPDMGTWVDTGDPTCRTAMADLDGQPRIRAGIVDIGAYEFQMLVGRIVYVDDTAPGIQDGSNWGDAFTDLQDALAVVTAGQEIHVAQGIYRPADPNGNRDMSFVLDRPFLKLLGGFAGYGATNPDDHDVNRYETILSGDLMGNDGPLTGTADEALKIPSRQDNSYHVVQFRGSHNDSPILDGFTITGGQSDTSNTGVNRSSGAGILIQSGSPVIRDCTVRENVAGSGAGIMLYACGQDYTGDLTTIIGCQIVNNIADGQAGIECCWGNIRIMDCLIAGNTATWCGGGIHNSAASLTLSNCRIIANKASGGGGLFNVDSEDTVIEGCVFHLNQAKEGSAIYGNVENDRFVMTGCIVWDNPCSDTAAVYLSDDHESSHAWVSYCDIEGGTDGISSPHGYDLEIGPGILNVDPLFADTTTGDYHLKSQAGRWDSVTKAWVQDDMTSPCIDAGDPMTPLMYEPFPNGGVINMGAHGGTAEASKSYYGNPVCEVIVAGDINGDCKVDLGDFAILARHWLESN